MPFFVFVIRRNKQKFTKKESPQMLDLQAFKLRAENEIRTRDPRFTKALLYQLSYFGKNYILCIFYFFRV